MMNRNFNRGRKFFFFIPVAVLIILALGYAVMFLWNSILPEVAKLGKLSYSQALGLLILCRLLFGHFRPGGQGRGFGRRNKEMREKWHDMTPDERIRFREEYRKRFRSS